MATCNFNQKSTYDKPCDQAATTTLKKHNGEIVQICEEHASLLIRLAKELEADHWLVLNKIPS